MKKNKKTLEEKEKCLKLLHEYKSYAINKQMYTLATYLRDIERNHKMCPKIYAPEHGGKNISDQLKIFYSDSTIFDKDRFIKDLQEVSSKYKATFIVRDLKLRLLLS